MADPGFPLGGRAPVRGRCGPPMQVLFGENVKTKELGPIGGGVRPPPRSVNAKHQKKISPSLS